MMPAIFRIPAALVFSFVVVSCASTSPLDAEKQLLAAGNTDAALDSLEQRLRIKPDDREARILYLQVRDKSIGKALADGDAARADGRFDEAEQAYRKVIALDPRNQRANDGVVQVDLARRSSTSIQDVKNLLISGDLLGAETCLRQMLADNPGHRQGRTLLKLVQDRILSNEKVEPKKSKGLNELISLEFRNAPLRSVFEALTKTSGINFVLDSDVKTDLQITIFVKQTALDEVVKMILVTNQLEQKLLNDNSILIYPKTPAKVKDYQELEARSFVLANVDVKQALNLVKTVVKTKDIFVDERRNLLVIRDTPEAIQLAERLLEALDVAEPEVMLEVEVLEVSRTRLKELGVRFPDQLGYGVQGSDGSLSSGVANLKRGLIPFSVNPALLINLRAEDTDTNLLANPRIRVRNMEKAKVHIGDKVPVFTTTSTANVGVSAAVNYLDVGLKLEVEPTVYLKDEVGMRVGLEVSSVTKTIEGPQGSLAYQIGNRSAATVLRLKDGETQILAGLISDEERNSANKLPGLGDIPVLGRLFSSRADSRNKTEIVLLITPRIVRNLTQPSTAASSVNAGTEGAVGLPPLRLRTTSPGSMGISGNPSGSSNTGFRQDLPPFPEVPPSIPLPAFPPTTAPSADSAQSNSGMSGTPGR